MFVWKRSVIRIMECMLFCDFIDAILLYLHYSTFNSVRTFKHNTAGDGNKQTKQRNDRNAKLGRIFVLIIMVVLFSGTPKTLKPAAAVFPETLEVFWGVFPQLKEKVNVKTILVNNKSEEAMLNDEVEDDGNVFLLYVKCSVCATCV